MSPRALGRLVPFTRLEQYAVHLAACAVALWPCAAHGPPLAAHLCVTPLAIISWLAKQDRIERELSTTRLSLSQLQNKSSQPPVPSYSSTVCNTGIQKDSPRYLSRFAFRIFFPPKRLYMSVVTCHSSQMRVVPFSIYGVSEATQRTSTTISSVICQTEAL